MKYIKYLKFMIKALGEYIRELEFNQKDKKIPFGVTGMLSYRDGKNELYKIIFKMRDLIVVALIVGLIAGFIIGKLL